MWCPFQGLSRGILKGKPEEVAEDVLYYKKGLKVMLLERLQDKPIEEINPISDPTFLVDKSYREMLLEKPISAQLEAELSWDTSGVLLVGSQGAEKIVGFPAGYATRPKGR
jgi:hypothetical protein